MEFLKSAYKIFMDYIQLNINEKKRKQDLFEKRYQFYEKLKDVYYSLDDPNKNVPHIQIEDISKLLPEALWLFGEDMRLAINNLEGREFDIEDKQLEKLPDEIERIFDKYMRIEK